MCKREALKWHRLDSYNFPHPPKKTQKTLLLLENDWKTFQSTMEPETIFTCFLLFCDFQVSFFPSKIACATKLKTKKKLFKMSNGLPGTLYACHMEPKGPGEATWGQRSHKPGHPGGVRAGVSCTASPRLPSVSFLGLPSL